MSFWNDIDTLGKIARLLPYAFIVLGFAVAASGQFVKGIFDTRIGNLEEAAESARRNTAPIINPYLAHSAETGDLLLIMDTENSIPYRASWLIVTENDAVVSPLMMEQVEIYPTDQNRRFSNGITVNSERVVNQYIELRFRWESVFSRQLSGPAHLRGEITTNYRFVNGQIFPSTSASSDDTRD